MSRALFTNNARTTLGTTLSDSATSVAVTDGSVFPAPGAGEHAYLTFEEGATVEIVKLTARSGNTLTIVRAQDGSVAAAFTAIATVTLRLPSIVLEEIFAEIDVVEGRTGASPVRTANFTFVAFGPVEMCDTTAGVFTGTLPPSPTVGDRVEFADGADFSVNALTIARNSQLVGALAEDVTINTQGLAGGFVFVGGSTGWKAFKA